MYPISSRITSNQPSESRVRAFLCPCSAEVSEDWMFRELIAPPPGTRDRNKWNKRFQNHNIGTSKRWFTETNVRRPQTIFSYLCPTLFLRGAAVDQSRETQYRIGGRKKRGSNKRVGRLQWLQTVIKQKAYDDAQHNQRHGLVCARASTSTERRCTTNNNNNKRTKPRKAETWKPHHVMRPRKYTRGKVAHPVKVNRT